MARSHILCALALIAGSLIFASTARADAPTFAIAKQIGLEYWAERDVTVPCDMGYKVIPATEWDEMEDHYSSPIYMIAGLDNCNAWVSPLAEWHRTHGYFFDYCIGIVHEMGHFAGLGHDYGGVMDDDIVWACGHLRQWKVLKGWRKPPRWVRESSPAVLRWWMRGNTWRARVLAG